MDYALIWYLMSVESISIWLILLALGLFAFGLVPKIRSAVKMDSLDMDISYMLTSLERYPSIFRPDEKEALKEWAAEDRSTKRWPFIVAIVCLTLNAFLPSKETTAALGGYYLAKESLSAPIGQALKAKIEEIALETLRSKPEAVK